LPSWYGIVAENNINEKLIEPVIRTMPLAVQGRNIRNVVYD